MGLKFKSYEEAFMGLDFKSGESHRTVFIYVLRTYTYADVTLHGGPRGAPVLTCTHAYIRVVR